MKLIFWNFTLIYNAMLLNGDIIQWAVPAGFNLLAVICSILIATGILHKRHKLRCFYRSSFPYVISARCGDDDNAIWHRIGVKECRSITARDIEVKLDSIERNGEQMPIPPQNLFVSNSNDGTKHLKQLAPGVEGFFDLFVIEHEELRLVIEYADNRFNKLAPGDYRLALYVSCNESNCIKYEVLLNYRSVSDMNICIKKL